MNSLADKYLNEGYDVIVDSNSDKYAIRDELYEMAERNHAKPYCFWVKINIDAVNIRRKERKQRKDILRDGYIFYVTPDEIRKYSRELECPRENEGIFIIDGARDMLQQLLAIRELAWIFS